MMNRFVRLSSTPLFFEPFQFTSFIRLSASFGSWAGVFAVFLTNPCSNTIRPSAMQKITRPIRLSVKLLRTSHKPPRAHGSMASQVANQTQPSSCCARFAFDPPTQALAATHGQARGRRHSRRIEPAASWNSRAPLSVPKLAHTRNPLLPQLEQLLMSEQAPLADGEIADRYFADAGADEFHDAGIHRFYHAADLAIAAFG